MVSRGESTWARVVRKSKHARLERWYAGAMPRLVKAFRQEERKDWKHMASSGIGRAQDAWWNAAGLDL